MIYETKNHKLVLENGEAFEINDLEYKFLIAISNENTTSFKEIAKYIYSSSSSRYIENVRNIKRRLISRIKDLKIKTISNFGYKLETTISYI